MLGPDSEDAVWVLEQEGRTVGPWPSPRRRPGRRQARHGPPGRGRGGGRALLRASLDRAQGAGFHKVELEVFPDNAAGVALYAAHGFEVEGLRRRHYLRRDGTRRDVLLMARLLGV